MNIRQSLESVALSKLDFKNTFRFTLVAGMVILFIAGCKKDRIPEVETGTGSDAGLVNPKNLSDSIYFELNGTIHSSNSISSNGMGNSGVRMKFLNAPVTGMKNWGSAKGGPYYSPADSIYFFYRKTFSSPQDNYTISFGKGFHVRDLNHVGSMWYPLDVRKMLSKGEQNLATDFQSFNAIDGVWFDSGKSGSTGMPESSFEDADEYPQNDAHFEIIKEEQVDKDRYSIEAKFEMNLYDAEHKKSRITNGFVRLNVYREWWGIVNIF